MTQGLDAVLRDAYRERTVVSVRQRPYAYASSFALSEVCVEFADGATERLVLKDFARARMLDDARVSRPDLLDDPQREIETYRSILAPNGIGPHVVASVVDPASSRWWLVCEKVAGVELWQVGKIAVWIDVVRWVAQLHRRFAGRAPELLEANPALLRYGQSWFEMWADRARHALDHSDDPRASKLAALLARYGSAAERLASLPATFIHGELYPSNVMVRSSAHGTDVVPVDWEMAAIGPGLLDVAALVSGWGDDHLRTLASAYDSGVAESGDLAVCRLHLALQWLGWSPGWTPPAHHARDWVGEALRLALEVVR